MPKRLLRLDYSSNLDILNRLRRRDVGAFFLVWFGVWFWIVLQFSHCRVCMGTVASVIFPPGVSCTHGIFFCPRILLVTNFFGAFDLVLKNAIWSAKNAFFFVLNHYHCLLHTFTALSSSSDNLARHVMTIINTIFLSLCNLWNYQAAPHSPLSSLWFTICLPILGRLLVDYDCEKEIDKMIWWMTWFGSKGHKFPKGSPNIFICFLYFFWMPNVFRCQHFLNQLYLPNFFPPEWEGPPPLGVFNYSLLGPQEWLLQLQPRGSLDGSPFQQLLSLHCCTQLEVVEDALLQGKVPPHPTWDPGGRSPCPPAHEGNFCSGRRILGFAFHSSCHPATRKRE